MITGPSWLDFAYTLIGAAAGWFAHHLTRRRTR